MRTTKNRRRNRWEPNLPPSSMCRCGKVLHHSKDDARQGFRYYSKMHNHVNEVRYYECEYGGWHWTQRL